MVGDNHGTLPGAAGIGDGGGEPLGGGGGQHLDADAPDFSVKIICDQGITRTHSFHVYDGEVKKEDESSYVPPPSSDGNAAPALEPTNISDVNIDQISVSEFNI